MGGVDWRFKNALQSVDRSTRNAASRAQPAQALLYYSAISQPISFPMEAAVVSETAEKACP